MCTFIGVECLAANALIELNQHGIRKISFEELADYGLLVVDEYEIATSERAVLIFSQEKIKGFIFNFSNYFEVQENDKKFICLKEDVDIRELKEYFRWTLSYEILKALCKVDICKIVNA